MKELATLILFIFGIVIFIEGIPRVSEYMPWYIWVVIILAIVVLIPREHQGAS